VSSFTIQAIRTDLYKRSYGGDRFTLAFEPFCDPSFTPTQYMHCVGGQIGGAVDYGPLVFTTEKFAQAVVDMDLRMWRDPLALLGDQPYWCGGSLYLAVILCFYSLHLPLLTHLLYNTQHSTFSVSCSDVSLASALPLATPMADGLTTFAGFLPRRGDDMMGILTLDDIAAVRQDLVNPASMMEGEGAPGTYTALYRLTVAGAYEMHVTAANQDIAGSAFRTIRIEPAVIDAQASVVYAFVPLSEAGHSEVILNSKIPQRIAIACKSHVPPLWSRSCHCSRKIDSATILHPLQMVSGDR
jgi:hypothetical protein